MFEVRLRTLVGRAVAISAVFAAAACAVDNPRGGAAATTADSYVATGSSAVSPTAEAESARSSVVASPSFPAAKHSRDADRDFLRHMLDHYEAVLVIVHADMMKPEGHFMHGRGADPVEQDAAFDADKGKMLLLLHRLYGEDYSPRPVAASEAAAEIAQDTASTPLATHFRAGIALVDRSLTALKRPEVRGLAKKVRATQSARLKAMAGGPAAER